MLAYLFERFPKFSQTFCYREVVEMWRQGERPAIFSLRPAEPGPEQEWNSELLAAVHYVPEGDRFAPLADAAAAALDRPGRKLLRTWRGKPDSLRLHQAVYLGAELRRLGVTHLHTHFAGMGARTAYWIRKFYALPFSVTVHANDIFAPERFPIGLAEIVKEAELIVAVSDFAAQDLRRRFPAARVEHVYNGVDLSLIRPTTFSAPPLLLGIGRLIPKKGWDTLIAACRLLRESGLSFRCEVIGEGPLHAALEAQAVNLGDTVALTGPKSQREIVARLGEASLLALPARVEESGAMDNLPTVIMEGMAAALPVVSTSVAGIPEMIVDGQTGRIVPPDDAPALAGAIAGLLRDPALARTFGQRGRERANQLFSLYRNVTVLRTLLS